MKKGFLVFPAVVISVGLLGYVGRGMIRQTWDAWKTPALPQAVKYRPPSGAVARSAPDSLVEGGAATSQHYVLISSPTTAPRIDPLADSGPLPGRVNLDVPFTSQAPMGDWSMPYQEACEEASVIMVDAFYHGISGTIPVQQASDQINAIVSYENKTLGFYKDTTAEQTAQFIKGYFRYQDVIVQPFTSVTDVKRALANGFPVIIPAAGKLLPNPYFRNGGPAYHMVVVKGYTEDRFITNDPGTRNGANFTYTFADLQKAAHDWIDGDVMHGKPVMLIVIPNPS